jgi:hypothetical protein
MEGRGVSFLQKARDAADRAAQQAKEAADQARARVNDPSTQERMRQSVQSASQQAREAAGKTKKGFATMVDRIDPGLLADIVIKATALQEKANHSLRTKGSPYRISEITITATIPPQVGFAIARVGDTEETLTGNERDSTELVAQDGVLDEAVISLDGTTIAHDDLAQAESELAEEEALTT